MHPLPTRRVITAASASDCTVYYDKNSCDIDCGSVVWDGALGNLMSNLDSYAQQVCSPMCMHPIPPCAPRHPETAVRFLVEALDGTAHAP